MRVLGGVIGLIGWFALPSATEADSSCPPSAVVHGSPSLAANLSQLLVAAGIATTPRDECPVLEVTVEKTKTHIRISFRDGYHRTGQRDVRDLSTAAVIVESWAVQEVDSRRALASSAPAPAHSRAKRAVATPFVSAKTQPSAAMRSGVSVAFESAVASDRSTWLGLNLSGCARIGPVCAGALVRAGKDTRATGESTENMHRTSSLAALATISLPLSASGLTISPGLALGYERLRASVDHMTGDGIETVDTDNHGLDLEANVVVRHALGRSVWVQFQLSIDATAIRSSDVQTPRGFVRGGMGLGLALP